MPKLSFTVQSVLNEFDPKDPTVITRRTLVTALHTGVNELNLGEISEEQASALRPGDTIECELTPDYSNLAVAKQEQDKAASDAVEAKSAPRAKSGTRH